MERAPYVAIASKRSSGNKSTRLSQILADVSKSISLGDSGLGCAVAMMNPEEGLTFDDDSQEDQVIQSPLVSQMEEEEFHNEFHSEASAIGSAFLSLSQIMADVSKPIIALGNSGLGHAVAMMNLEQEVHYCTPQQREVTPGKKGICFDGSMQPPASTEGKPTHHDTSQDDQDGISLSTVSYLEAEELEPRELNFDDVPMQPSTMAEWKPTNHNNTQEDQDDISLPTVSHLEDAVFHNETKNVWSEESAIGSKLSGATHRNSLSQIMANVTKPFICLGNSGLGYAVAEMNLEEDGFSTTSSLADSRVGCEVVMTNPVIGKELVYSSREGEGPKEGSRVAQG